MDKQDAKIAENKHFVGVKNAFVLVINRNLIFS